MVAAVLLEVLAASLNNAWREYDEALEHEFRLLEVRASQREANIVGAMESVSLMLSNVVVDVTEKPSLVASEKAVCSRMSCASFHNCVVY